MNQCQGCMAEWPVREAEVIKGHKFKVHEVVDGYAGEIVSCTAYLYEKEEKSQ